MRRESNIPWIKAEEILCEGRVRENVLLLDVRTPKEFDAVHIPGSVNMPLGDLPSEISDFSTKASGKEVVVLCRTQNRAKLAHDHLERATPIPCQLLEGGITTWIEKGFLVSRGEQAMSLERQVRIITGLMVVTGVGLGVAINSWLLWVPVLVGAGLIYAGATDSCAMAMFLAWLPFNRRSTKTVLTSSTLPDAR